MIRSEGDSWAYHYRRAIEQMVLALGDRSDPFPETGTGYRAWVLGMSALNYEASAEGYKKFLGELAA